MKKNENVDFRVSRNGLKGQFAVRKPEASERGDSLRIDRFAVKSPNRENLFAHGDASHVQTGSETVQTGSENVRTGSENGWTGSQTLDLES